MATEECLLEGTTSVGYPPRSDDRYYEDEDDDDDDEADDWKKA